MARGLTYRLRNGLGLHRIICGVWAVGFALTAQPSSAQATGTGASSLEWLVDANIGALKLDSSDLQAAADARLGISQDQWGIMAWGNGSAYQFNQNNVERDTQKLDGAGEAWFATGSADDSARFLLRASGGGASYWSSVIRRGPSDVLDEQTSWMGRGALLLGVALTPSDAFASHLSVGGGMQYEWYDYTSSSRAIGFATEDTQDLTFLGLMRFDTRWAAARDIMSIRIRVGAKLFRLTRDNEFIQAATATARTDVTQESLSQLEVTSRGFIDIDAASFYGFRPTLHGGLDYVRVSGDEGILSTINPVFGVGLIHPWK